MLTPTKNYKMSRAVKTLVAGLWNHPNRSAIKRAFVESELAAAIQPRRERKSSEDNQD
jgi:hypothetical protein